MSPTKANETRMCTIRFKSILLKRNIAHKCSGYRVCLFRGWNGKPHSQNFN